MIYQILPAAMLLAVLLTLGIMSRHNEIIALRTGRNDTTAPQAITGEDAEQGVSGSEKVVSGGALGRVAPSDHLSRTASLHGSQSEVWRVSLAGGLSGGEEEDAKARLNSPLHFLLNGLGWEQISAYVTNHSAAER